MFVLNSVGLIQRVRVLHCCVLLWALAVFTGHTAEWSYCDGHLAFRSVVPAQPFFPTTNTGHPPNFSTLAPNCAFTQSTAWHHVNHGQHPFFPRPAPLVTIVGKARCLHCRERVSWSPGKINADPEKSHTQVAFSKQDFQLFELWWGSLMFTESSLFFVRM